VWGSSMSTLGRERNAGSPHAGQGGKSRRVMVEASRCEAMHVRASRTWTEQPGRRGPSPAPTCPLALPSGQAPQSPRSGPSRANEPVCGLRSEGFHANACPGRTRTAHASQSATIVIRALRAGRLVSGDVLPFPSLPPRLPSRSKVAVKTVRRGGEVLAFEACFLVRKEVCVFLLQDLLQSCSHSP
jgi:hypothetical protein